MSIRPPYRHVQKAPLCLLIYAIAVLFFVLGLVLKNEPPIPWLFPPISLFMVVLAASFHQLEVEEQAHQISVGFGPLPLFRRTIPYDDITSVQVGRTTLLDGWGIHMSLQGGWIWNLWGRDCVIIQMKKGVIRVGTDDAEGLAGFLRQKMHQRP